MRTKQKSLREIRHHLENTQNFLIKVYNKKQLSIMDWIPPQKIDKMPYKYLPVRIDNKQSCFHYYTPWYSGKKPYSTWYIRLDEIKWIYKKRTGKDLVPVSINISN